jgi:hypothetical protein
MCSTIPAGPEDERPVWCFYDGYISGSSHGALLPQGLGDGNNHRLATIHTPRMHQLPAQAAGASIRRRRRDHSHQLLGHNMPLWRYADQHLLGSSGPLLSRHQYASSSVGRSHSDVQSSPGLAGDIGSPSNAAPPSPSLPTSIGAVPDPATHTSQAAPANLQTAPSTHATTTLATGSAAAAREAAQRGAALDLRAALAAKVSLRSSYSVGAPNLPCAAPHSSNSRASHAASSRASAPAAPQYHSNTRTRVASAKVRAPAALAACPPDFMRMSAYECQSAPA